MKYFYKFSDREAAQPKENYEYNGYCPDAYWTKEDIKKIPLYEETDDILSSFFNDDDSEWWPVFNTFDDWKTWETDYVSKDAAYDDLMLGFNQSIYEYRHDI